MILFLVVGYSDRRFSWSVLLTAESLIVMALLFTLFFIIQLLIHRALREKHTGWTWASVAVGVMGAAGAALLSYEGRGFDSKDLLILVVSAGVGLILGLALMVLSRWIVRRFFV